MKVTILLLLLTSHMVSGCATATPQGPSMVVLPAPGKPFSTFRVEDADCRNWAARSAGMVPSSAARDEGVKDAAAGTLIGAGAGALIGSASGHVGAGAAIGAGAGLLMGVIAGSNSGQLSAHQAQRRYDSAYAQCMVSHGNQVSSATGTAHPRQYQRQRVIFVPSEQPVYYAPPPPPAYIPAAPPPAPGGPPPR